jgi:ribosomal protein S11
MFTWQMSAEQRRRELEDRREVVKAAKAASDAAALAATQAKKAAAVAANALQVVHVAVQEVGVQAVAAYQEANNANLKIQAVQDVLTANMGLPDKPITAEAVRKKGACE